MAFKHDVIMLVLIIVKYRLRQDLFEYGTVYNRITLAVFFYFYFAVLKIHVASKILESTKRTNKLFKKKILQMWKLHRRTA